MKINVPEVYEIRTLRSKLNQLCFRDRYTKFWRIKYMFTALFGGGVSKKIAIIYEFLIKNLVFNNVNNVDKVDTLSTLSISLSKPNMNFTIFNLRLLKYCTIISF